MTTKAAAIHAWINSFGVPAYPASAVPDDAEMPYLTYTPVDGAWDDPEQPMQVDLWYRGESEAAPNAKADEISRSIGLGGTMIGSEAGAVWVRRGSPFCQSVPDEDRTVKRRMINLTIEFFTVY